MQSHSEVLGIRTATCEFGGMELSPGHEVRSARFKLLCDSSYVRRLEHINSETQELRDPQGLEGKGDGALI